MPGQAQNPPQQNPPQEIDPPSDDVFRVMIFTDTHCGHKDQQEEVGNDATETFEEVLALARQYKCDLITHSGDMFDENKPTRKTHNKVLNLLTQYCLGGEEGVRERDERRIL
jgi:double-strand break repair protein MRE11